MLRGRVLRRLVVSFLSLALWAANVTPMQAAQRGALVPPLADYALCLSSGAETGDAAPALAHECCILCAASQQPAPPVFPVAIIAPAERACDVAPAGDCRGGRRPDDSALPAVRAPPA